MNQLILNDEMISCLNSAIDKILSLRCLAQADIDRAKRIYNINDSDAVLAKANLLGTKNRQQHQNGLYIFNKGLEHLLN